MCMLSLGRLVNSALKPALLYLCNTFAISVARVNVVQCANVHAF